MVSEQGGNSNLARLTLGFAPLYLPYYDLLLCCANRVYQLQLWYYDNIEESNCSYEFLESKSPGDFLLW